MGILAFANQKELPDLDLKTYLSGLKRKQKLDSERNIQYQKAISQAGIEYSDWGYLIFAGLTAYLLIYILLKYFN